MGQDSETCGDRLFYFPEIRNTTANLYEMVWVLFTMTVKLWTSAEIWRYSSLINLRGKLIERDKRELLLGEITDLTRKPPKAFYIKYSCLALEFVWSCI